MSPRSKAKAEASEKARLIKKLENEIKRHAQLIELSRGSPETGPRDQVVFSASVAAKAQAEETLKALKAGGI